MSERAVANGVVVVLILGAAVCLVAAARDSGRMNRANSNPAFRLPVDFSVEGVYRATVHDDYAGACRRVLHVQVTPGVDAGTELDDAMKGLDGDIVAAEPDGREFFRGDLWWSGNSWGGRGKLSSDEMYPRGTGPYVVTIHVRKPAAGMAGKRQEVVGEYDFCESDMLPVFFKSAAGLGLGGLAGIVLIARWLSRWRSKRAARA